MAPGARSPDARLGLFGAARATTAPSEEDEVGLTRERLAILVAHLTLSVAHIFAVHQSAKGEDAGEGEPSAGAARSYAYNPAMVVLTAEVLKLLFSASVFAHTARAKAERANRSWRDAILDDLREAFREHRYARFAVPALIYLVENHLRFVVLRRLASPITWVVFSHVEIPIVAVLSYAILRRPLGRVQWIAIAMLLDGVMSAEIALCHASENQQNRRPLSSTSAAAAAAAKNCDAFDAYPIAALSLVLLGATLAALAGISVEYTYKGDFGTSIHLQNAQLYAFGAAANFLVFLAGERASGRERGGVVTETGGWFRGFDLATWWVVLTLAAFGIVSSLIMKHLSNIAKVFNSAAGMVLVTTLSWAFLGTRVNLPFALAGGVVVASLLLFYANKGNEPSGRIVGPGSSGDLTKAGGGGGGVMGGRGRGGGPAEAPEEAKQLL